MDNITLYNDDNQTVELDKAFHLYLRETVIKKIRIDSFRSKFIAEKVLDIIKKKEVNVNTLINCIIGAIEPLEFYNEKVSENLKLTQQEFYLLEEVLGE